LNDTSFNAEGAETPRAQSKTRKEKVYGKEADHREDELRISLCALCVSALSALKEFLL
jgi:hypothetical protein